MLGEPYLISSIYYADARRTAIEQRLSRRDWIWIPAEPSQREKKLVGRRITDEKFLIGSFTDKEREYLLRARNVTRKPKGGVING